MAKQDSLAASNAISNHSRVPQQIGTRDTPRSGPQFTQPVTMLGLGVEARGQLVVSSVVDDQGIEVPLSRFEDRVWDLSPLFGAKNKKASAMQIRWPSDVSDSLLIDAKSAVFVAMKQGRYNGRPLSGSSLVTVAGGGAGVLRHLTKLGLAAFAQVRSIYLMDYLNSLKAKISPATIRSQLELVDMVWEFSMEMLQPLPEPPWGKMSFCQACGISGKVGVHSGRIGKTLIIPIDVQRTIFSYCEGRIAEADTLLKRRDLNEILTSGPEMLRLRGAVLYLTQITSGMRNSEVTSIAKDSWRVEVKTGKEFHWVRTREYKTTGGVAVDFLVPPELFGALEKLQRYAEPLQGRLREEARWLERLLAERAQGSTVLETGQNVSTAVARLSRIRQISDHLFLCVSRKGSDHLGDGSRVDVMSDHACNFDLRAVCEAAGVEWRLANHQCRRTFSHNVANSKIGRFGLVFLKWQLKHVSLAWTQCYAASPQQDLSLYREMNQSMIDARIDVIESWLPENARLSGGAGRKILATRGQAVKNARELLELTADAVELRSTGHAWCISGTRACNGQGVYFQEMCGSCSRAVIDETHAEQWQRIHLDNMRLAALTDCGPAVQQRSQRVLDRSAEVLADLNVPLPTDEQARAYDWAITRGADGAAEIS